MCTMVVTTLPQHGVIPFLLCMCERQNIFLDCVKIVQ